MAEEDKQYDLVEQICKEVDTLRMQNQGFQKRIADLEAMIAKGYDFVCGSKNIKPQDSKRL